jgi:hypothetical protein
MTPAAMPSRGGRRGGRRRQWDRVQRGQQQVAGRCSERERSGLSVDARSLDSITADGPGSAACVCQCRRWVVHRRTSSYGKGRSAMVVPRRPRARPARRLEEIADRLRRRLGADPPGVAIADALPWLDRDLDAAGRAEQLLLPRRMQLTQPHGTLIGFAAYTGLRPARSGRCESSDFRRGRVEGCRVR